jgi:exonuclease III
MNAKDKMIDIWRKEAADDAQYCDWLDQQQEWLARLVEQGYIPTTKETRHAEI